jgi:hypothetical protein
VNENDSEIRLCFKLYSTTRAYPLSPEVQEFFREWEWKSRGFDGWRRLYYSEITPDAYLKDKRIQDIHASGIDWLNTASERWEFTASLPSKEEANKIGRDSSKSQLRRFQNWAKLSKGAHTPSLNDRIRWWMSHGERFSKWPSYFILFFLLGFVVIDIVFIFVPSHSRIYFLQQKLTELSIDGNPLGLSFSSLLVATTISVLFVIAGRQIQGLSKRRQDLRKLLSKRLGSDLHR